MYGINQCLVSLFFTFFILSSHIFFICNAFVADEVQNERPFSYIETTKGPLYNKGPSHWGQINPKWRLCNTGERQSPMDLVLDKSVPVTCNPEEFKVKYQSAPAALLNRGHDIELKWNGDAGGIIINGTFFVLIQGHWHSPSEHTINGKRFKLEFHALHQNSKGSIAVVAILYDYGSSDSFLLTLIPHIASLSQSQEKYLPSVHPNDIGIPCKKVIYEGSLTVPPCTEGVLWIVDTEVREVLQEQIEELKFDVHDGFQPNARPIQPPYGRRIRYSGCF